jgi:hypothetical protein
MLNNDLFEDFTCFKIYMYFSIFQNILYFPSKKLVFEKIFNNNFNVAEN